MRHSTPKSLDHLLGTASPLTNIKVRSLSLSQLNRYINNLLPDGLKNSVRVANYRQGILIIEVATASWLTRLRYEQEKLISALRKEHLTGLSSIQYKINPSLNENRYVLHSKITQNKIRTLSPYSASLLIALANGTTPKLKASLIKLANNATKLDNSNNSSNKY